MEKWERELEDKFADPDFTFEGLYPSEVAAIKEAFQAIFEQYPLEVNALAVQFPSLFLSILEELQRVYQVHKFLEVIELYRVAGQGEDWVFRLTVDSILAGMNSASSQAASLN